MSYQVLARKWRPQQFDTVVAQQHVLRALSNALDHQRLHHAYLFTGSRGVGKTSIARILAKCLNCEAGISAKPCGECQTCVDINNGCFVDLIEIDGASKTKVEDTQEILNNVQYCPTRGRYKIYLIDEVHMLSRHSFNALLKTLEEPPKHVIFILATTDPQKLPITVLSRCLQFHLKNISAEAISKQLAEVLTAEAIPFEAAALDLLAKAADGSMRDSLSLLDQAIAYGDNSVNTADVSTMLGTIDQQHIIGLITALANNDGQTILDLVQQLESLGADFAGVLEQLLETLHKLAIEQVVPGSLDGAHKDSLEQLSQTINKEDLQLFYQIGLHGRRDLPLAPNPRCGFEMALLRMLAFKPGNITTEIPSASIQTKVTPKPATPAKVAPVKTAEPPTPVKQPEASVSTENTPTPVSNTNPNAIEGDVAWLSLFPKLKLSGVAKALAENCILAEKQGNHFNLLLDPSQQPMYHDRQRDKIQVALSEVLGEQTKVKIEIAKQAIVSPAYLDQQARAERHAKAEQAITSDPAVQNILEQFDGTIQTDTIQAAQAAKTKEESENE